MASNPEQSNTERGAYGEDLACQALVAHGYQVVERNWRSTVGEVDIVAREDDVLVFVEVKLRQGDAFGTPEEAVTPAKQERLLNVGQMYIADQNDRDLDWRIDVVAIVLAESGRVQRLDLYRNAVTNHDG